MLNSNYLGILPEENIRVPSEPVICRSAQNYEASSDETDPIPKSKCETLAIKESAHKLLIGEIKEKEGALAETNGNQLVHQMLGCKIF